VKPSGPSINPGEHETRSRARAGSATLRGSSSPLAKAALPSLHCLFRWASSELSSPTEADLPHWFTAFPPSPGVLS
jgi:hypothetical protein